MIGAGPAVLQVLGHRGVGLSLSRERLRQAEQRPAVVGMIRQFIPVDALGVGWSPSLEQRRTEPVARGERQWFRLVVGQRVLQSGAAFERRNGTSEVAVAAADLAV